MFSCTTGSAPSAAEVLRWLDDVMGFPALNGYGSTECGVTILNNKVVAKWVPFTFPLGACSFAVCNTCPKPSPSPSGCHTPFPWVHFHLQCEILSVTTTFTHDSTAKCLP